MTTYYCTAGPGCHGRGEQSKDCPSCEPRQTDNTPQPAPTNDEVRRQLGPTGKEKVR